MRLREADHRLELARRGGDAAVRGGDGVAQVTHLDVGRRQGLGGRGGDFGVDVGACVGDVGCEELDGLVRVLVLAL